MTTYESRPASWRVGPVGSPLYSELVTEVAIVDRDIAERVARRLRERGINGPRGPLSGGTILREALQGGRWKRKERIR